MDKQIHIYSVDTSAFYNENERKIHKSLNNMYVFRKKIRDKIRKEKKDIKRMLKNYDEVKKEIDLKVKYIERLKKYQKRANVFIKYHKNRLCKEFKKNKTMRKLNVDYLNKHNIVSVFESVLTRTMNAKISKITTDIIIVQTFFFDVIEDIILDGFMLDEEKYVCFTASAGQIRTKKTVFIKESVLHKYQNSLMCGLTIDEINNLGGVNINKFLAYLALCNSATDIWNDFDIAKTIVVKDMETIVNVLVDFIDDETYKIERKTMDIKINHTDGCGMILPSKSKKNMMVRLPWIKGLLVSFPFDKFIEQANKNEKKFNYGLVKDIYGKEYDILKDGIEIIFTESQFKMYKYYGNWQKYVDNFIKYSCQAGKCNEEEDVFDNKKINYQMLQTLSDMSDNEIEKICEKTKYNISRLGNNERTMLKVLGVVKTNNNKNFLQQALEIYPELLNDKYSKEILKQIKKSMVKDAKAGKIEIEGTYTYFCPDLYAFCEFLFQNNNNPNGLLKNDEVFCNIYKNNKKLDCLRSPHLYREHAIRNNVADDKKSKWFITNGLYTSCHDAISKILMFDNDGDKSLVVADSTIIKVAERNMQNIVPLFYNMKKANPTIINNLSIYNGLKTAYTGGNIGEISNDITKIWNSGNVNLNVIKWLCMENNFTIDYAKTLYKPKRPKEMKDKITEYTKLKVPHFFIYAKDKTIEEVEPINNSVVNKLHNIIKNTKINFKSIGLNNFNYKMLMKNKNVEIDEDIIKKYKELDLKKHFIINYSDGDEEVNNIAYLYWDIRQQILEINNDIEYVVDVLVQHLYGKLKSNFKTTLWESFGDILVKNLKENIKENYIYCKKCGILIEQTNNRIKYCKECSKEIDKEKARDRMKNIRNVRNRNS